MKSPENDSAYVAHSYQLLKISKASFGTLDMSRNSVGLIEVNSTGRSANAREFCLSAIFLLCNQPQEQGLTNLKYLKADIF